MVIPQRFKNRITIWPSNPTSGCAPRRIESRNSHRFSCTLVTAALLTMAGRREPPVPTYGWTDIMLGEISQSQNNRHDLHDSLVWGARVSQIYEDRKESGGLQEPGGGQNGELIFNGYSFSFARWSVLEMDGGGGGVALNAPKTPEWHI